MDAAASASAGSFSGTSSMILSVSIVGILATSLLLLTYYLLLTKCGFASSWRPNHDATQTQTHRVVLVPAVAGPVRRGLEAPAIRRIPTFLYRNPCQDVASECAVCLSEFQAGERLRLLPPCLHAFHIDCIDAWLQATANCPLCRVALSDSASDCHHLDIVTVRRAVDDAAAAIVIDVASPGHTGGGEVGGHDHDDVAARTEHSSIMGDECIIDARRRGDRRELLGVQQPIRRSLSMDSCGDKHFYLALQKILEQQHFADVGEDGKGESSAAACRSSGRLQRSFFSGSEVPSCQSEYGNRPAGIHQKTDACMIN